ncbi:MAG: M15 family metallopeptidase [Ignavibacteriae bacterium]|nr:M15 family metallopeptidase [Ignavibacteriota bacterium]
MNRTNKLLLIVFILPLFISLKCNEPKNKEITKENTSEQIEKKDSKQSKLTGLQKLIKAYPDYLEKAEDNKIYWKDGTVMNYDDGKEKTHDERLENADIEDMMKQEYVVEMNGDWKPEVNYEPGRIRYEPFFEKLYGNSQSSVTKNLTTINWFGTSVQVSTINNVDKKLAAIMDDLNKLPEKYHKYFKKTAGTFNYRKIAGTDRYSAHAYGIAIDINTEYSDYWQWDKSMKYKNRIPIEVAEVFEKHGFIWGAKWYHYDTMHFEYRPELLQ